MLPVFLDLIVPTPIPAYRFGPVILIAVSAVILIVAVALILRAIGKKRK